MGMHVVQTRRTVCLGALWGFVFLCHSRRWTGEARFPALLDVAEACL